MRWTRATVASGALILTTALACRDRCILTATERLGVAAALDSATRSFEEAQRSRDAERLVGLLDSGFYMYADGARLSRDTVVAAIRRDFAAARHVEPGFRDIEVIVQAANAGLTTFRFADSVVMASGEERRTRGSTTLAWTRRGGRWVIAYADAVHEARPSTNAVGR